MILLLPSCQTAPRADGAQTAYNMAPPYIPHWRYCHLGRRRPRRGNRNPRARHSIRDGSRPWPTPPPDPTPHHLALPLQARSTVSRWRPSSICRPEVSEHLREIYANGQALGRDPHAFAKVGDSTMAWPPLLAAFENRRALSARPLRCPGGDARLLCRVVRTYQRRGKEGDAYLERVRRRLGAGGDMPAGRGPTGMRVPHAEPQHRHHPPGCERRGRAQIFTRPTCAASWNTSSIVG